MGAKAALTTQGTHAPFVMSSADSVLGGKKKICRHCLDKCSHLPSPPSLLHLPSRSPAGLSNFPSSSAALHQPCPHLSRAGGTPSQPAHRALAGTAAEQRASTATAAPRAVWASFTPTGDGTDNSRAVAGWSSVQSLAKKLKNASAGGVP